MFTSLAPRVLKTVVAAVLALGIAACAQNPEQTAGTGGMFGAGGAAGAASPGSSQDFVANVGDRVFFESDSSDLTPTAVATLDRQAAWLSRYPRHRILVEGHADERGTREYNFSLGSRRAQTVRDYLASRGVDAGRVRTVSYGKERPVAVCDNISCWSQNRRAVTALEQGVGS